MEALATATATATVPSGIWIIHYESAVVGILRVADLGTQ